MPPAILDIREPYEPPRKLFGPGTRLEDESPWDTLLLVEHLIADNIRRMELRRAHRYSIGNSYGDLHVHDQVLVDVISAAELLGGSPTRQQRKVLEDALFDDASRLAGWQARRRLRKFSRHRLRTPHRDGPQFGFTQLAARTLWPRTHYPLLRVVGVAAELRHWALVEASLAAAPPREQRLAVAQVVRHFMGSGSERTARSLVKAMGGVSTDLAELELLFLDRRKRETDAGGVPDALLEAGGDPDARHLVAQHVDELSRATLETLAVRWLDRAVSDAQSGVVAMLHNVGSLVSRALEPDELRELVALLNATAEHWSKGSTP